MKEQKKTRGLKIFWIKDEKEFYSLIEEKMQKQGFVVFETSPPFQGKVTASYSLNP